MTGTGENNVASGTGGSPTWLAVLAATSLGVIFLIAGLSLGSLSADSEEDGEPESAEAPESEIQPSPAPVAPQSPAGDWTAALYGSECPAPCSAGPLCATTAQNTAEESPYCKEGSERCIRCASEITCVPGEPTLELAPGEQWELHLSAVRRDVAKRSNSWGAPERCDDSHDYWVCLGAADSSEALHCLGPHDSCSKTATSRDFFRVATEDMVGRGLRVEIRRDGKDGFPVVSRTRAGIHDGMRRRALCNGFLMRVGEAEGANWAFTFFLEPANKPYGRAPL